MKLSLISATSFFALLTAAVGPAHATPHGPTPDAANLFDLLPPTPSAQREGGAQAAVVDILGSTLRTAGFTGQRDANARGMRLIPLTPLGAAAGTDPFDEADLRESGGEAGSQAMEMAQTVRTTAAARVATLIGSVPATSRSRENSGATVLMAAGAGASMGMDSLNAGSTMADGPSGRSLSHAFASGSTSTATITVAATGNLTRPGLRATPYVVATSGQDNTTIAGGEGTSTILGVSDVVRAGTGYTYAPASRSPSGPSAATAASFSDTVRAGAGGTQGSTQGSTRTTERTPSATDGIPVDTVRLAPTGAARSGRSADVEALLPRGNPGNRQGELQTTERGTSPGARSPVTGAAEAPAAFTNPISSAGETAARPGNLVLRGSQGIVSGDGAETIGGTTQISERTPPAVMREGWTDASAASGRSILKPASFSNTVTVAGDLLPSADGYRLSDLPMPPRNAAAPQQLVVDFNPLGRGYTELSPSVRPASLLAAGPAPGSLPGAAPGPRNTDLSLNTLPALTPSTAGAPEPSIESFPIFTFASAAGVQPVPVSVNIPMQMAANASPGLLNSPLAMPLGQLRFESAAGINLAAVPEPASAMLLGGALLGLIGLRRGKRS